MSKHCQKGGEGDYNVCWFGFNFWPCECADCIKAYAEGDENKAKQLIEDEPEAIKYILANPELIEELK